MNQINQMSHFSYRIAQVEEPFTPNSEGLRTFEGQADNSPVTVNDGAPVYSSTIYWIFAIVVIAAILVAFFLKRADRVAAAAAE